MQKKMLTIGALAAIAGTAAAQPAIVSFTYSDLTGSFDAGSSAYTASANAMTAGDVTRLDANPGSAEYDTGTLPGSTADVEISLSVTNIMAGSADGNGTITLTDDDGDTITGDLDGQFVALFGSVFFEGELTNVFINDITPDATFDGSSSGSFSTAFGSPGPYVGSLVELFFDPGNFFGSSFSNETTLASGLIVPAPGTAALAGLGGLLAIRRRRA